MSRYNRCKECYNMKCVFVTGEREDFDTSECPDFRGMTNADRIRVMTDEELAEWIAKDLIEPGYDTYDRTYQWWLTWLKKEAGE